MRMTKLENGEIVIHTKNGSGMVFNKIEADTKYIAIYVKDSKLFWGRSTIYLMQCILNELNSFAAFFSLLSIMSIVTNTFQLGLLMHSLLFMIGMPVAMKCLVQLHAIKQTIRLAYWNNRLDSIFEKENKNENQY